METPKSPHPLWTDHCWVLLMQLYMHKPTGTKALYSRRMVELSLELHIPPQILYAQQLLLRRRETPFLQRLWNRYAHNPHQLSRQLQLKPCVIVEVLRLFQSCDPWLHRQSPAATPLATACRQVWQDHGNGNPEHLSALAAQLMAFWNKK